MVPEKARAIILQNVWTTPSVIATEVQRLYPDVLTTQIYYAWKKASQGLWMRDENQMESAIKLLDENTEHVERFDMESIEGVTALAWGLKSVVKHLRNVIEVAMDATCKSLYSWGYTLSNNACYMKSEQISKTSNCTDYSQSKTILACQLPTYSSPRHLP